VQMKWIFGVMILCLPSAAFGQEAIGSVTTVQKKVWVAHEGSEKSVWVRMADPVLARDTYKTGPQSRVKLLFEDDSIFVLSENAEIQITENIYDPASNRRSTVINLFSGAIRTLVGKPFSGAGSKLEIHTPTATAAARGTYFVVWIDDSSGAPVTGVLSLEGEVDVCALSPSGGCLAGQQGDLTGGEMVLVGQETQNISPVPMPSDLPPLAIGRTDLPDAISADLATIETIALVDEQDTLLLEISPGTDLIAASGTGSAPGTTSDALAGLQGTEIPGQETIESIGEGTTHVTVIVPLPEP